MARHHPGSGNLIKIRPRRGTVQVSRGRTVLATDEGGEVHPDRFVEGLYVYDTRTLSQYFWRMNGKKPEFSVGSNLEQSSWLGYYVQAPENCKDTPAGECDPLQETVELRLTRSVGEGMHEDVQLTNHTQISTTVRLELRFALQFVSRDEVQNGRKQKGHLELNWSQPSEDVWELMADYRARHKYSHQGNEGIAKLHRGMKLRIEHATSAPEYSEDRISFEVQLAPHGTWRACLSWLAYVEGQLLPLSTSCSHIQAQDSEWEQRRTRFFNSAACFSVPHSDDLTATVGRVLERSRLDLGDLRLYDLDSPGGIAVAAGIPTYIAVFGRDMEATSWEASTLSPDLLRGSLNVFNTLSATEENDWRDAEPGRIPHEIHTDPLAVLNFRPKSLYFGSVSSSFLFPVMVSELWRWTGDLELVRKYVDTAMGAIKWADTYSLDSSGFYRYQTRSEQGEKNQGWKDSADAIVYPDGSQVKAPIGTCEMQAFMYAAKLLFSELMWRLDEVEIARSLHSEAEDLKARFNERFWMEDEGYFGIGIDPDGELIRTVASDPGQCLLSGIVDQSRLKRVASRMMREDLFSGWGIRTLSAEHPAYNPFSYHRGSVWPVTNAAFTLGFARYGLHGEMHQLAKAVFEAASLFDHDRLPEVFGGHQRTTESPFPGLYTKADWPQAWSASTAFAILQALLGLHPYAPENLLFLDPHLPEWLPEITIERLRVGNAAITLRFHRTSDGDTEYEILDLNGRLHVVRQPSPWSLTTGWAERIRDVARSFIPHAA
ncbi:MAG TPA: glycogen debranching N-terminal domain-containing protein [Silvibacterium sp.]|nr:glycogen debranching N-terminal domain-containing protein [Silvibacterium sp.]